MNDPRYKRTFALYLKLFINRFIWDITLIVLIELLYIFYKCEGW